LPANLFKYKIAAGKNMTIRALLVGVNYTGTPYELKGCINDATCTRDLLQTRFKANASDIVVMTDDKRSDDALYPAPANIIGQMKALIAKSSAGDTIYFHYSGHGFTVESGNHAVMTAGGGRIDAGLTECVLARHGSKSGNDKDITAANTLCGDAFNRVLELVPPNVFLFGVIDTCNSGTVFDLTYNIRVKTEQECTLTKCEKPENRKLVYHLTHNENRPCYRGNIILFSSVKTKTTAWDTTINGRNMGALTGILVEKLKEPQAPSYLDLLFLMHNQLKVKYDQDPQLSYCKLDLVGRALFT
jgi:hypothetical protein